VPREVTGAGREEYLVFERSGFAKVACTLAATRIEDRTVLWTETRVHGIDEPARRAFGRYGWLISWGSGWLRTLWLRAIKRRAERGIQP
jgi:hypothetical protein